MTILLMLFQGGLGALGGLLPMLLIMGVVVYFVIRGKNQGPPIKSIQHDEYQYYCTDCRGTINPHDKVCPHCGADTGKFVDEGEESPERKARMELTQGQKVLLWIIGVLGFFGMVGGLAELFNGRSEGVASILFWPIVFCVAYAVIHFKNQSSGQFSEAGGIDSVIVGNYLAGLPSVNQRVLAVTCDIYEDEFVFMDRKWELDRIPRDSINQITVDNKSQITQRLTATRMLALGVFALAAPKKQRQQEFCLLIDWDDYGGMRQNTVFDFLGPNGNALANQAANTLRRYVKVKVDRLKVNEKKCPYCAEIIKREARICKHCHSEVE